MAHVFISYAHVDSDFVAVLKLELENAQFVAWVDSEHLRAGKDWRRGIDEAIESSIAVIVIMTPEAKASEYVTYEWAFALGAKKEVIPVLLKPTNLHPRLEVLQYLDFGDFEMRPWERLINHLRQIEGEISEASARAPISETSAIQSSSIQRWLIALRDPDTNVRQAAADTLGQMKDVTAIPDLLTALRDKKERVRQSAARALGTIGHATAVNGLLGALHDADYQVREAAAKALGEIKQSAAVPGLQSALDDPDKWVRAAAHRALKQIATPEALAAVEQWRRSQDGQQA